MQVTRHIPASELARLLGDWRVGGASVARQLAHAVEKAIHDGRLPLGVQLPAERLLAAELGLARGTVTTCYQFLRTEQLISTRTGSGSTTALPPHLRDRLAPWSSDLGRGGRDGAALDLTIAEPAAPFDELLEAVHAAADSLHTTLLPGAPTQGGPSRLRTALADTYTAQGLPTDSRHLLLTSGADAALHLLCAALLHHGSRVVTDSPTYPGALTAFRSAGARPIAQPLAPSGWDVPALDHTLRTARPALAYLIPDFHNPTGLLMSEEQRDDLRRRIRSYDTLLVVDETTRDLDLRDAEPPPARLTTRAGDRGVLTVGSLSKSLWPGLRIGWIRAHPDVVARLSAHPLAAALAPSPLNEVIALHLLEHREKVLAHRRDRLRAQRDHLVSRLSALSWCRFRPPQGGLSLWLELLDTTSSRLAADAAHHGLLLTPGSQYSPDGAHDRYLRLPFTLPTEALDTAVDRLTTAHDH
ncbi:PLP-dependent aminotransferase family protein [Streptomyces sp. NPDC096132]|uniref:aminotransferase-like domain-containing protein n=1 Tax=Streptomyces sp. NPDC096132 TaxID=3366075 RepID=UPI0037FED69E